MSDVPPQNLEAEQAVLGAILVAADRAIPDAVDVLRPADYYRPAHEAIHVAAVALWERREPVDPVTVAAELAKRGELDRIGGAPYLHTLMSAAPVAASVEHHARIVADRAVARRLVAAGMQVQALGESEQDMTEAARMAERIVAEATESAATAESGATVDDALAGAIDWLENPPVGADTPWADVNDRTNGLHAGQMVTVAGRPGHGKSLVLKDVALFTALQGKPVHVATLEMSRNEYMARILSGLARVNLSNMLNRKMSESEWGRVSDAADRLRGLPLYLDDRPGQSMAQIRAAARQTARRFGKPLGLVGIDYAQLVRPADTRIPREQQVAQISRDTKLMAKEHHCPVMLLAQLNRANTQRTDHTPQVSDLRESGSLEQDSDQVWLLHRPDQYDADTDRLGEVDLIVGKNRNGPFPVVVPLAFQGHYGRIVSLA